MKDPYIFDFLSIGKEAHEREVEKALIKHKHENDQPSIGLILCKSKNNILAEYTLRDMTKPIGLAEYRLEDALPENLQIALPTIEELEAELAKNLDGEEENA